MIYEFPEIEKEMSRVKHDSYYSIPAKRTNNNHKVNDEYEMLTSKENGEVPHIEDYIYKNMDSATFQKLKKLKALAKSDNEEEAFLAFRKCMELCKKFNLEFDKLPELY